MEIYERIDELARVVEAARAMPLSTSCVVPRNDVLDLIDDIREALPASIKEADDVLAEREDLIEEATKQAQDALAAAQTEASAVIAQAHQDSDQIIDNARAEADGVLDRARAESARLVDEQEVLLIAQERKLKTGPIT